MKFVYNVTSNFNIWLSWARHCGYIGGWLFWLAVCHKFQTENYCALTPLRSCLVLVNILWRIDFVIFLSTRSRLCQHYCLLNTYLQIVETDSPHVPYRHWKLRSYRMSRVNAYLVTFRCYSGWLYVPHTKWVQTSDIQCIHNVRCVFNIDSSHVTLKNMTWNFTCGAPLPQILLAEGIIGSD